MNQANKEAVERVRKDPAAVREILAEYRERIDRARSEYIEAAEAYLESYEAELSDHRERLAGIKRDRAKYMPPYIKGVNQRPLARLAERAKPGTIKEHEGYLETLRIELEELKRIEGETLAVRFLGSTALWGELLRREQSLYEIEEEARLTRLEMADVISEQKEGLKELVDELDKGIRQTVEVKAALEFYNLEHKHDQTVKELINEEEGTK